MVVMLRGSLFMPGGLAACAALIGMLATGCASAPPVQRVEGYSPATGEKAAATALTMVGKPYRFRGETPSGFDCSGLVRYSYLSAGIDAPHGTMSLMKITTSVGLRNARLGDLLFFTQMGKKYSHVAIYIGNNAFVHAPSTGGSVRKDSMDDPYWQKHYLDTRRFL
jgi:cell wall-associated NlpC family hydrolase